MSPAPMRVLLLGATGMVGRGVLLECLDDARVAEVVVVGRTPLGVTHGKLREHLLPDLFRIESLAPELRELDVCLFCLGVSAAGMSEEAYRRITLDLTLEVARVFREASPEGRFLYVSGQGTDSTGTSRQMWARVKGDVENTLLEMGFPRAWMFRPGIIQPMRGVRSSTALYQALYTVMAPLTPLLSRFAPGVATTSVKVGQAMIRAAAGDHPSGVFETRDINRLAER